MCITLKATTHGNEITWFDYSRKNVKNLPLSDLNLDHLDDCVYLDPTELNDIQASPSDLTVLQLNVRGLINKQSDLTKIMEYGGKNKVNVALLCETWLRQDTKNLVNIPDYNIVSKEQMGMKGGGVSILIQSDLKYQHRADLEIDSDYLEHVIAELKSDKRPILLVSCYCAPNTDQVQFLKDYKSLLHSICSKDRRVIVGLDHNLDLLKNNTHRNTQEFLETNWGNKLLPCISKPTRITHSTATLIDNTFCSVELHGRYKSYILIDDISDHMPCLSILSDVFPTKMSVETITQCRLTEKAITEMKDHLESLDWSNIVSRDRNC